MKIACVLCAALVLLLASFASASELQMALSRLPDEDIMKLFNMVVLEMYTRGLSPDSIVAHVDTDLLAAMASPTPATAAPYARPTHTIVFATFTPTPAPTPLPTPRPTYAPKVFLAGDDAVWITDSGERFHTTPDCSGMRSPYPVTYHAAIESGRTACHDCAWWMIPEGE